MPANVEWKGQAHDPQGQQALAAQLADSPPQVLEQVDTFFSVEYGYLKLRQLPGDRGELIHYVRPEQAGPKLSKYSLLPIHQSEMLRCLLAQSLGIMGEVRKRRHVYIRGQSRIHFDVVESLGTFLEVEVVLQPDQSFAEGETIASDLRHRLDVRDQDLIAVAYIELMKHR